jgi:hypothetical protein
MNGRYALMNRGLDALEHETFAGAFRGVPGLTPMDASLVGHPGCGMLVRNLTLEQATILQSNLKPAGTETEIVSEMALPVLPGGKVIRSLECATEVLTILDCLQHRTAIGRAELKLLAAGSVRMATFARQRKEQEVANAHMMHIHIHPIPLMIPVMRYETRVQYVQRESEQWILRAEIISSTVDQRFIIEAENFNYSCSGSAMTCDLATNFCLLIRRLAETYSLPILSRGVSSILADPWEFAYYPNKDVFHNDLVWLLWRNATLLPAQSGAV